LGVNAADAVFANGLVRSGDRSFSLAEAAGGNGLVAEDFIEFGDLDKNSSNRRSARISSRLPLIW